MKPNNDIHDLIIRLRVRASIRRNIQTRRSVQEGKPDRLSDLLEEAADSLSLLQKRSQYDTDGENIF
jgi:predicted RNA-binding Zn ribbon-like protein